MNTNEAKAQVKETLRTAGVKFSTITGNEKIITVLSDDREAVLAALPGSYASKYNPRTAYINR